MPIKNLPKAPKTKHHVQSILALPFMVVIVIPAFILWLTPAHSFLSLSKMMSFSVALLFFVLGIYLFITCLRLFMKKGKGTLAPWNPTQKLIVEGPYSYVRNPMISGVLLMLLSEALVFNRGALFLWVAFFFVLNNIYFRFKEEPDLIKRFGNDYLAYRSKVPRWIPRFRSKEKSVNHVKKEN